MKATKLELATILGLSERRIDQLIAERVIPDPTGSKFDLGECVRRYVKFIKAGRDLPTLTAARISKLNVERELRELELAEKRGELVSVFALAQVANKSIAAMRQRVLSVANLLPEEKDDLLRDLGALYSSGFGVDEQPAVYTGA